MEELLKKIYSSRGLKITLFSLNIFITSLFVIAGGALIVLAAPRGALETFALGVCALFPFVIVSIVRRATNAPRPLDVFKIEGARGKTSPAFPSRHALCSSLIAVLMLHYSVPLAIALLPLSLVLSALRVLLGYHFPRDVITATLIGIISALLGIIILL